MALGRQADAPGEAGLWRSPGVGGGGADGRPLLHRVSPVSLAFVPRALAGSPATRGCQCCLCSGARPQENGASGWGPDWRSGA